jgi:hypothetical protein
MQDATRLRPNQNLLKWWVHEFFQPVSMMTKTRQLKKWRERLKFDHSVYVALYSQLTEICLAKMYSGHSVCSLQTKVLARKAFEPMSSLTRALQI